MNLVERNLVKTLAEARIYYQIEISIMYLMSYISGHSL